MASPARKLTVDDEIEAFAAEENDRCKKSCKRFTRQHVRIEDRDESTGGIGIAIPFVLWPLQLKALAAILIQRLTVILKARQLGQTWMILAYAVWRIIYNPGYSVVALSKKEDDAKELIRRVKFILKNLPAWMTREKSRDTVNFAGPVWEATVLSITIYHPKKGKIGEYLDPSVINGMSSAPDSARSFTSNLVILDEWAFHQWAEDLWTAAYPTINRPTGGQVIGLSTNKRGSMYELVAKDPGKYDFSRIFLPWWTDPRRTKEWYEKTKKALPNTYRQEYPATPEEAFSAGEGTAFPEYSEMIHVCKPFAIPLWWRRWRGNDPGYADPFAFYWFAVSPDGIVYIYREYTRDEKDPRVTYSDQARKVLKLSIVGGEVGRPEIGEDGKPLLEKIGFTTVGRDAWNKLGRAMGSNSAPSDGKSIIDCYAEGGLHGCTEPPRDTKTDRVLRKAIFHEYLKPFEDERTGRTIAKLQIFNICTHLIEAIPNLVNDEKTNEKVALDPHVYTNPWDAAGYGLVAWHVKQSKVPEPEKTDIQRDKERLAKLHSFKRNRRRMG